MDNKQDPMAYATGPHFNEDYGVLFYILLPQDSD